MENNVKIFANDIEDEAVEQIQTISSLPQFSGAKIRIMPDVHAGKGCVCGFTANLGEKVVPNLVGVDIGCGILVVKLGKVEINYEKLDNVIRENIPSGCSVHGRLSNFTRLGYSVWNCNPNKCIAKFANCDYDYFKKSVATLGGGNHFIEIDENSRDEKFLLIHTGSRNLGKKTCEYWQDIAVKRLSKPLPDLKQMIKDAKVAWYDGDKKQNLQEVIENIKSKYQKIVEDAKPENLDLAYLEGEDRDGYLHDMKIVQRYADLNRKMIAYFICRKMGWSCHDNFTTMHNYIGDDNIIRKSAISAYKGQNVCIPLNMRDGSLICLGKGNEDWNNSAPRGAGRKMSRRKARETLNMDEYRKSMDGIYTTSVSEDTIDEAPFAYKNSADIIEQISDTVEIVDRIFPKYNFKAAEVPFGRNRKKNKLSHLTTL